MARQSNSRYSTMMNCAEMGAFFHEISNTVSAVKWIFYHLWLLNCWKWLVGALALLLSVFLSLHQPTFRLHSVDFIYLFIHSNTKETVSYLIEFPVNGFVDDCYIVFIYLYSVLYCLYWNSCQSVSHCFNSNVIESMFCKCQMKQENGINKKKLPRFCIQNK